MISKENDTKDLAPISEEVDQSDSSDLELEFDCQNDRGTNTPDTKTSEKKLQERGKLFNVVDNLNSSCQRTNHEVQENKEKGEALDSQSLIEVDDEEGNLEDPYAAEKEDALQKISEISQKWTEINEAVQAGLRECRDKLSSSGPTTYEVDLHQAAKRSRYNIGVQSEYLMKHLMTLDKCISYGSDEIKVQRKALVSRVKDTMEQADTCAEKWLERVEQYEVLKNSMAERDICSLEEKNNHKEDYTEELEENSDGVLSEEDVVESEAGSEEEEVRNLRSEKWPTWQPRANLSQNASQIIVTAPLPGLRSINDLTIELEGTDLLVQGTKMPTRQELWSFQQGYKPTFGKLSLRVRLPLDNIHPNGSATYENGVLRVEFQKKFPRRHLYRRSPESQGYTPTSCRFGQRTGMWPSISHLNRPSYSRRNNPFASFW